jgi:hypothetical protein
MTAPQPSEPRLKSDRLRSKWISLAFVVLASLAALGATTAYWVNQTLLDEDRFMEIVTPIVASDELAESLGDQVAARASNALGVEQRVDNSLQALDDYLHGLTEALDLDPNGPVGSRLPEIPDLTLLADPIVERVENRISGVVVTLVSTDEFQSLIDMAIRNAHKIAVVVATGDDSGLPDAITVDGDIELNLRPLIAEAIVGVVQAGADAIGIDTPQLDSGSDPEEVLAQAFGSRGIEVRDDFGRVVLVSEEQLAPFQGAVKAMSVSMWMLIALTVLLSAAAIWTHPNRVVGTVWLGVGIIIAQLINWPVSAYFVGRVTENLSENSEATLINVILQTVSSNLLGLAVIVIIFGALIALGALFFAGWQASQDHDLPAT